MRTIDIFALCIIVLMIALILLYSVHFRKRENSQREESEFIPVAAWLRAGIFFCFFYLFSWVTGTMETILKSPIASNEQLAINH